MMANKNEGLFAVRNIRLCSKDCLCLYVCPTHATDTENGQVDWTKCIGCGACAMACPSGAISMVPKVMPAQKVRTSDVASTLASLVSSKAKEEGIASALVAKSEDSSTKALCEAISQSARYSAEDLERESGYMIPQSQAAVFFMKSVLKSETSPSFPKAALEELIATFDHRPDKL